MPYLAVIGHSNIDVQLDVGEMPGGGRSSPVKSRRTVYGGTAANIARHAAGLGCPVRLWSRVGHDFPDAWRDALESDGVELALDTPEGALTPTCFILSAPDGEQAYCMDQAAMRPPYTVPETVLDGIQWLHVSTGDPASYQPLVKAAKAQGIQIALDPGQEIHYSYDSKSFHQMLELADLLFVNEVELQAAFKLCNYGDPVQFLDHVDALIVTHGAHGADLWTEAGKVHVDAAAAEAVDATGAGDALRAGFYAGLHAGKSMQGALGDGVKAGTFAVTLVGPQPRAIRPDDLS